MDIPADVIRVPPEFRFLFIWFGQHVPYTFKSIEDAAQKEVMSYRLKDNAAVKAYLDDLISGRYSEEQLYKLWFYSGADVGVGHNGAEVLAFLQYFRSLMD